MDASYVNSGPSINQWLWNFGDGNGSSLQHPVHDYLQGGKFNVELVVTNEAGCNDTAEKEVSTEYVYYFPNAFSPNDDGINDFFAGSGFGSKDFKLTVFNRYGQVQFTTSNPGESWNGKYNGHRVPLGTYIYVASITDFLDNLHELQGAVCVIR